MLSAKLRPNATKKERGISQGNGARRYTVASFPARLARWDEPKPVAKEDDSLEALPGSLLAIQLILPVDDNPGVFGENISRRCCQTAYWGLACRSRSARGAEPNVPRAKHRKLHSEST